MRVRYWRMGVSEVETEPWYSRGSRSRPVLGTVGFPFPWKCYDELCRRTAANGWGLLLLAPTATDVDRQRWRALNPWVEVVSTFLPQAEVVACLRGCDATAFTYVTHNTGQSGAILQGIAAGKPVFALETCRQFRALHQDPLGREAITWGKDFNDLSIWLQQRALTGGRFDGGIIALREQDSWRHLGKNYAGLYRQLAEAKP